MTDHSNHHTILTETGSIRLVAADVIDTRKDVLYCIDCCQEVHEVPASEPTVAVDLDSVPF